MEQSSRQDLRKSRNTVYYFNKVVEVASPTGAGSSTTSSGEVPVKRTEDGLGLNGTMGLGIGTQEQSKIVQCHCQAVQRHLARQPDVETIGHYCCGESPGYETQIENSKAA
ncbi:hypothetical protein EDD11_010085 [Mortierella claussenii]|nr:hypothetical protein EDD11_010085 [Mortierella claussenii]